MSAISTRTNEERKGIFQFPRKFGQRLKKRSGRHRNRLVGNSQLVNTDSMSLRSRNQQIVPGRLGRDGGRMLLSSQSEVVIEDNEYRRSSICGEGNDAAYGPCYASSYRRLDLSQLPTSNDPAYAGIPFTVVVRKMDSYDQQIVTDSASVIQTLASTNCSIPSDSDAGLDGGQVMISVLVKPYFSLISESNMQVLQSTPYVYMKGIDSQADSLKTMISDVFAVIMACAICPLGYILVPDQAQLLSNTSALLGSCSQCQIGTYSVSPLAGTNPRQPSCLNCPASGNCKGGADVDFSLGTWKILGGMYRLVGCPAGYQLVNSLNGVFSHDLQNCVACALDDYIVDSNNSYFKCQQCPVGAVCDGSDLVGLVKGSVWIKDMDVGLYTLQSCPPGYEIQAASQESQECQLCNAYYYCLGGSNTGLLCPGNAFSPPGANSSSACFSAVVVAVSVSLPLTVNEFNTEEISFRNAMAVAAGVAANYVVISGVSSTRRSSTGGPIQV